MPDPSTLAVFCFAALALLVVPGPAVLYIVTRSIDQGRAAGIASVAGVHAGTLVHLLAAALGLSALLMSSALAFSVVKYLGAAYLIYLGMRTLLARDTPAAGGRLHRARLSRIVADGIVVETLNPKTALFFLAFLPQFLNPSGGAVAAQIAVLGAIYIALGLLSDGAYALLAARAGGWLKASPAFARGRRFVTGGIYLALGATAALSGSRSPNK